MNVVSIDDLDKASSEDIRAAISVLNLKKRVLDSIAEMGKSETLTLDEYKDFVASQGPRECSPCSGTGVLPPKGIREIGVVHPSQAHKCRLKNYYDVTGEFRAREETPWRMQATFAIGHAIHDLIQRALLRSLGPEQFKPEAHVDIAGFIRGNADGDVNVGQARAVLEIKTMGAEFDELKAPLKYHRLQATGMYATALNAPFTVFLYVSKMWPYPIKEFVEEYDPVIFQKWMNEKGTKIKDALRTGTPPMADASPSECAECPYAADCPQKVEKKNGVFQKPRR